MTVYDWPRAQLDARAIKFSRRGQVLGGPVSLDGASQVASIDTGYWIATYDVVTLAKGAQIKMFRAMDALLDGGANQVRVPVIDEAQAPWPGALQAGALVPWSDGTSFSDGSMWSQRTIAIVAASDTPAAATSLAMTILSAAALTGGEYFSIGDRLHVIRSIISDDGAGNVVVSIRPRLRDPVPAATSLNFDAPVCRMRLLSESEMDLALGRLWQAQPSIAFIEAP